LTPDADPVSLDRFVLRWHRAAVTVPPAQLPGLLLASLGATVPFGQAVWVVGVGAVGAAHATGPTTTPAAPPADQPLGPGHLHATGLDDAALAAGTAHWLLEQVLSRGSPDDGRASAGRLKAGHGPLTKGQPLLAVREPDAPADARQALILLRPAGAAAFGADEQHLVERLAPHAMQAITTARTLADARRGRNPRR
jgi:hypothetical protein